MARKKEPKPILAVKHDFIDALENMMGQSLMLVQALQMALDHGQVADATADILKERLAAFRKAIFNEETSDFD